MANKNRIGHGALAEAGAGRHQGRFDEDLRPCQREREGFSFEGGHPTMHEPELSFETALTLVAIVGAVLLLLSILFL